MSLSAAALPPTLRVCGKIDMLDQILCRLQGHHKVAACHDLVFRLQKRAPQILSNMSNLSQRQAFLGV